MSWNFDFAVQITLNVYKKNITPNEPDLNTVMLFSVIAYFMQL